MGKEAVQGQVMPRGLDRDSMVLQHNSLARGKYESILQLDDIRLFNAALAKMERGSDMLGDVVISASEMREVFPDYANNNRYSEKISRATDRLMGMIATIHLGKTRWEKISLIQKTSYNRGQVTFQFHEDSKDVILRLGSGNYTSYRMEAISNLTTTAQVLLYQWARSYAHIGRFEAPIDLVRSVLNTKPGAYPRESKFVSDVLKPTVDYINDDKATDILVSFRAVKKGGRTTVGYEFRVSLKQTASLTVSDEVAIEYLREAGISNQVAGKAVREHGGTTCIGMLAHMRWREKRLPKIESPTKYLGKLLADGVIVPVENEEHRRILDGLMLSSRMKIFERLSDDARKAHLDAFAHRLTDRNATDWQIHRNPIATPGLRKAWHAYVMVYVANAEGAIVISKVPTTKVASIDARRSPLKLAAGLLKNVS